MSASEKYRNEWKYLIDTSEKEVICRRLGPLLKLDSNANNGSYTIRSLYFDDYYNTAYSEKTSGVLRRKKYRIRIYNGSDSHINLERKKKHGSYILKETAEITKEEFYKILDGDFSFLLYSENSLLREFYYECLSNVLRPRTIVDYEREPWIFDEGTVRITFDTDVRAAVGGYDIFDDTLPTLPVLEAGKCIMEVKFTEFFPEFVRKILPNKGAEFTAVSKYVLCYDKTEYLSGFKYWGEN
ncbi:MAG: polyphosphate polymerase domain-containing protein [Clostridia bacterium]|nr:polyphosphate polymerase domain-containing protein [Clostridia bacterium]